MNRSQRAPDRSEGKTLKTEKWTRELVICKCLPIGLLAVVLSMIGAYVVSKSLVVGIAFLILVGFLAGFRWAVAKVRVWTGRREARVPSVAQVKNELLHLIWPDRESSPAPESSREDSSCSPNEERQMEGAPGGDRTPAA